MSSGSPTAVGVDLGTTYTCAAVVDAPGGAPRVVQLSGTSQTIPSVVSSADDGGWIAGEAAERRLVSHASTTVREFKRRLGDATPVVLGTNAVPAEELTGHLLREVLDRVEQNEGSRPSVVGLSHPASWGPFRLDLLRDAARHAGVDDVVLVPEPVAAAVANRDRVEPGSLVAVYDLGGGTFDAAVVRMGDDVEVVGTPEGVERLGGIDFDQAVMAHVDAVTGGQVFGLDRTDPDARASLVRLRAECQSAKEHLSQDSDVDIPVALPGVQTSVRMTRAELEGAVRPRLADSLAVFDRVVSSAGAAWSDIGSILLVGGSSNMPVVAQIVAEHTGRPVVTATSPHLAIASGTAVVAAASAAPPPSSPAAVPPPIVTSSPATEVASKGDSGANPKRTGALVGGLVAIVAVIAVAALVLTSGGDDDGTDDAAPPAATDDTGDADGDAADDAPPPATEPDDATDPVETDPAPVETDPAPVATDPVATEPVDTEPGPPAGGAVLVEACATAPDGTLGVVATDSDVLVIDGGGVRILDGVDATACDFDPAGGDLLDLPAPGAPVTATSFGPLVAVVTDAGGMVGASDGVARQCDLIDGPAAMTGDGVVFPIRDGAVGRVRTRGGECSEQDAGRLAGIDATAVGVASSDRIAIGGFVDGAPTVRVFADANDATELGADDLPGLSALDAVVRCGDDWCIIDGAAGSIHLVSAQAEPIGTEPLAGTPLEGFERVLTAVPTSAGPALVTFVGSDGAVVTVTLSV